MWQAGFEPGPRADEVVKSLSVNRTTMYVANQRMALTSRQQENALANASSSKPGLNALPARRPLAAFRRDCRRAALASACLASFDRAGHTAVKPARTAQGQCLQQVRGGSAPEETGAPAARPGSSGRERRAACCNQGRTPQAGTRVPASASCALVYLPCHCPPTGLPCLTLRAWLRAVCRHAASSVSPLIALISIGTRMRTRSRKRRRRRPCMRPHDGSLMQSWSSSALPLVLQHRCWFIHMRAVVLRGSSCATEVCCMRWHH